MAEWVYVEDNEVVGQYDLLPKSWKNISGLNLSANNLPFLKSIGWYPVIKSAVTYNSHTHFVSGFTYEILEDGALEKAIIAERPPEETLPPPPPPDKNTFLDELRKKRDELLADSDWTQLADVQLTFDEETKERWKVYRQKLRDIVEEYLDNDIVYIDHVSWPEY